MYLDGQKCTSSAVSSCPWKIPRGAIEGLSVVLMIDPADSEVLVAVSAVNVAFITSQFAMTRVFGTLPLIYRERKMQTMR